MELIISRLANDKGQQPKENKQEPYILSDRIFVRFKERMVKIYLSDINYVEAERAYCRVHTTDKEYLITLPLKSFFEKISSDHFLRVHRSFVVNLSKVDELAEDHLVLGKKMVPISKQYKEEVNKYLRMI